MRISALVVAVLWLTAQTARAQETPTAKQFQTLLHQYEKDGGIRTFAKRFLTLAEDNPRDLASVDALLWVVKKVRGRSDTTRALELMIMHHAHSDKLNSACPSIAGSRSIAAERLLRAVLAKHSNRLTRSQACYHLAVLLDKEANILERLKTEPELTPRILQYYGHEYGKHLVSRNPVELAKRREDVYALMLKSFSDIKIVDTTMGNVATRALFGIRHLSVGKLAPEITGQDIHSEPIQLSDYRGKVIMLSFWGHW